VIVEFGRTVSASAGRMRAMPDSKLVRWNSTLAAAGVLAPSSVSWRGPRLVMDR
jgi:hypothetical protein